MNDQRLPAFQFLIPGANKALEKLHFERLDWNKFMNNGKDNYDEVFGQNKKFNTICKFTDKRTGNVFESLLKKYAQRVQRKIKEEAKLVYIQNPALRISL
jgi:hypothetical protein